MSAPDRQPIQGAAHPAPAPRRFHPEQASMFLTQNKDKGFDNASTIVDFSWSEIERRLNELDNPSLLQTNDNGGHQEVPECIASFVSKRKPKPKAGARKAKQPKPIADDNSEEEDDVKRQAVLEQDKEQNKISEPKQLKYKKNIVILEPLIVLTISLNNHACDNGLPCKPNRHALSNYIRSRLSRSIPILSYLP
jgi:hypothetical protein